MSLPIIVFVSRWPGDGIFSLFGGTVSVILCHILSYAIDVYTPLAYMSIMSPSLHVVAELPQFLRDMEAVGISEAEHRTIIDAVAANPRQGDEIRGSGGVRKVRFAGRGKGKSGGYRVVTAYFGPHAPVYLLALLSKGERGNFTASEIAKFRTLTHEIARYWRKRTA